eukprot:3099348-Rhodomonas_salina.1
MAEREACVSARHDAKTKERSTVGSTRNGAKTVSHAKTKRGETTEGSIQVLIPMPQHPRCPTQLNHRQRHRTSQTSRPSRHSDRPRPMRGRTTRLGADGTWSVVRGVGLRRIQQPLRDHIPLLASSTPPMSTGFPDIAVRTRPTPRMMSALPRDIVVRTTHDVGTSARHRRSDALSKQTQNAHAPCRSRYWVCTLPAASRAIWNAYVVQVSAGKGRNCFEVDPIGNPREEGMGVKQPHSAAGISTTGRNRH